MAPEDKKKITFITDRWLFYYRGMRFSLKNAGTTYQHLVNKIFKDPIRWNMEVYVDDMLVKSKVVEAHIDDLREAFTIL